MTGNNPKTALITAITGQDGAYVTEFLQKSVVDPNITQSDLHSEVFETFSWA